LGYGALNSLGLLSRLGIPIPSQLTGKTEMKKQEIKSREHFITCLKEHFADKSTGRKNAVAKNINAWRNYPRFDDAKASAQFMKLPELQQKASTLTVEFTGFLDWFVELKPGDF
jgi:hypothetical protein